MKRLTTTLLTALGGCAATGYPTLNEGENPIEPGMTTAQVLERLGPPYHRFAVRLDNAMVWDYRMRYGSCLLYQVSVLPSGIVKDASTGPDPACERID